MSQAFDLSFYNLLLKPLDPAEAAPEQHADREHGDDENRVAVLIGQLRHVLKVHAVKAGKQGGYCEDTGPSRQFTHDDVLLHGDRGGIGVDGDRDHLGGVVDCVTGSEDVIEHITKVRF